MTAAEDRPSFRRLATGDDGQMGETREQGRPRATPLSPGAQSEPLTYQTVQRPPGQPEARFRPRRTAQERDPSSDPALQSARVLPMPEMPQYRPRDYSPEGRRAVPSWAPIADRDAAGTEERLDYRTLTRAEVRAATARSGASDVPEDSTAGGELNGTDAGGPATGSHPESSGEPRSTPEQPLTRRQLRALREAQEAEAHEAEAHDSESSGAMFYGAPTPPAEDAPASIPEGLPSPAVAPVPRLVEPAASAPTSEGLPAWAGQSPATLAIPIIQEPVDEFEASVAALSAPQTEESVAAAPEPAPDSTTPSIYDRLFDPPAASEAAVDLAPPVPPAVPRIGDPLAFLDAAPTAAQRVDLPAPVGFVEEPPIAGQPPVEPPGSAAPVPAEAEVQAEAEDAPAADAAELHPVVVDLHPLPAEPLREPSRVPVHRDPSPSGSVPVGHWTTQAAADDAMHADIVAGRTLGGGHGVVTTNALVLPVIPTPELAGPLNSTGEILITGSIDVPRSLSSTGAHPTQLDRSSLDHELDPGDQQVVSVDSQPVRAIKAVSSNTSTRGMMTNTKPRGNRGLTVLIFVTAGLAAVVVGVLIVGVVNHAF